MKRLMLLCLLFIIISISAVSALAYETDIIQETPKVRANMVIILDNSISMFTSCEGPKGVYDKNIEYGGPSVTAPYDKNKYYKSNVKLLQKTDFLSTIAINEKKITDIEKLGIKKEDLDNKGIVEYLEYTGPISGNKYYDYYYTGNYLNWFFESRINFAKRALINLMQKMEIKGQEGKFAGFSYAIMTYNRWEDGGSFESTIEDCADKETQCSIAHLKKIKDSVAKSSTAEALRETGFYFEGVRSIYDTSKNYKSPIQYRCQPNIVLIVSDGGNFLDHDYNFWWPWGNVNRLVDQGVMLDYLDDVAEHLNKTDLRTDLEGTQNVITLTAGFEHIPVVAPARNVGLKSAAVRGGGDYVQLKDVDDLYVFVENFMNFQLRSEAASYGLSIPPDDENNNYSSDYAYMSFFKPRNYQGRWIGNIKKYSFHNGQLSNSDDWTGNTSLDVESGGVRQKLVQKQVSTRKIFTTKNNATDPVEFISANFDTAEQAKYKLTSDLIGNIRCGGTCINGLPGEYALGDIVHFQPLVHKFKSMKRVFAGANDGMLHCFNDDESSPDYGSETWAYIPEMQLQNLNRLTANRHSEHPYFVDGGRTLYHPKDSAGGDKDYSLLIFGERRGGKNYYALQVNNTNPDEAPKLQYTVEPGESFGQSWSNPRVAKVVHEGVTKNVFWIGGGYDKTYHEDLKEADKNSYTKKGKGVYAIYADSAGPKADPIISLVNNEITDCVIDPISFNPGYEFKRDDNAANASVMRDAHSRIYACDMAGNLWGFRDDADYTVTSGIRTSHMPGNKDGNWSINKIFGSDIQLKVFHRPEVVLEIFTETEMTDGKIESVNKYNGEYIYFGTGDREAPSSKPANVQNRFYGISNYWKVDSSSLSKNDLADVTDSLKMPSGNKRGWYIRLTNAGEKVVSHAVAYRGMVFFTTYTPAAESSVSTNSNNGNNNDPCNGAYNVGTARLYALNYKTGAPVLNLNSKGQGADGEIDEPADKPLPLCKSDRSEEFGSGMPGAPQLVFPENGGTKIIAGVGNRVHSIALNVRDMTVYYWKEKR